MCADFVFVLTGICGYAGGDLDYMLLSVLIKTLNNFDKTGYFFPKKHHKSTIKVIYTPLLNSNDRCVCLCYDHLCCSSQIK